MRTVALASSESRRVSSDRAAWRWTSLKLLEDGVGLLDFFWGRLLATVREAEAQAG